MKTLRYTAMALAIAGLTGCATVNMDQSMTKLNETTASMTDKKVVLALNDEQRKQLRVLNEAEPFRCIECGKPFGTLRGIEAMVAKIGQHPAFAGDQGRRLRMCSDCRVVAMFSNPNETRITDL